MNRNEMYNKCCAVWLAETARLADKLKQCEYNIWKFGLTPERANDFFKAVALQEYFNNYMMNVLEYLEHFSR